MHQVFTNDNNDYFVPYPLNIQLYRKCFLVEYIMKTPKDKFHPKAKAYFLEKNSGWGFQDAALALLASDNFTEEEFQKNIILRKELSLEKKEKIKD